MEDEKRHSARMSDAKFQQKDKGRMAVANFALGPPPLTRRNRRQLR